MPFSLTFCYVIISLLLQIRGGLAPLCYICNSRDHAGCEDIRFGKNNTFVQFCDHPCATVKGQWGLPGSPRYMIWRGCDKLGHCTQATALCCTCMQDYCNYDNVCFSRGNSRIPGFDIFVLLHSTFLIMVY